jgi:flavin reductase (DIM6/NTAB) family NADH-FMN oxidoreductase RutF
MKQTNPTLTITGGSTSRLLNPRAAVLVTCCEQTGKANAISVAWHTPLSHDPPLVGISIGLTRYSHELITATGEYVINVVGQDMQAAVEFCGEHSGRDCDKLALASLELRPARHLRSPVLAGALGHLECRVEQEVLTGDHTFFVGRVLTAEVRSDCFDKAWVPGSGDVLLCLRLDGYGRFVYGE